MGLFSGREGNIMSLHRRIVRSNSASQKMERALATRHRRLRAAVSELLEMRRMLAYTGQVVGNFAQLTGDNASDSIVISSSGGLLSHSALAGFNSAFDFDSTAAGDQTLADDAANSLLILAGDGADSVNVGNASFAGLNLKANLLFQ